MKLNILQVLFIELRLPVSGILNNGPVVTRRHTSAKLTTSTKKNLIHLTQIHPLPEIIIEYRRLTMLIEKTLNPLLEGCKKALTSAVCFNYIVYILLNKKNGN